MSSQHQHTNTNSNHDGHAPLQQRVQELEQQLAYMQAVNESLLGLFDELDDGLLLIDEQNTILAANQALADIVGSTPAALKGRNWEAVCSQHGLERFLELVHQTRQDGRTWTSREQIADAEGDTRILDIRTLVLYREHQHAQQIILHVVDMTERLNLEAMLIQSERQAATGKLSATIAHEVNTPLQAIQSSLYMAGRASEPQRKRHLSRANEQINRINTILQRLLDLHDVRESPPALVNINGLLEHLLELLQATLQEQHIHVRTEFEERLPRLWGKIDEIQRALLNLVLNAIEAMPSGGTLTLRTRSNRSGAQARQQRSGYPGTEPLGKASPVSRRADQAAAITVEIADTGIGIKPEVQTRIFDPFFTTRPGGGGIGLTVSKKIITEHGGQIRMQSTPGLGSVFTLLLPFSLEANKHIEQEDIAANVQHSSQ